MRDCLGTPGAGNLAPQLVVVQCWSQSQIEYPVQPVQPTPIGTINGCPPGVITCLQSVWEWRKNPMGENSLSANFLSPVGEN